MTPDRLRRLNQEMGKDDGFDLPPRPPDEAIEMLAQSLYWAYANEAVRDYYRQRAQAALSDSPADGELADIKSRLAALEKIQAEKESVFVPSPGGGGTWVKVEREKK